MTEDPRDTLRIFLMQEVLPVGIAMVERARKGGVNKVAESFTSTEDPLQVLRKEGEPVAKSVREQLDKVSPGLGNPVVPVEVAVEVEISEDDQMLDKTSLMQCLERIQVGIEDLDNLLGDDCGVNSTSLGS